MLSTDERQTSELIAAGESFGKRNRCTPDIAAIITEPCLLCQHIPGKRWELPCLYQISDGNPVLIPGVPGSQTQ